eukprot:gene16941-22433_t
MNGNSYNLIIPSSKKSNRTYNPIRDIVDNLRPRESHPLPLLNLALGDPTVYGNLRCPEVLKESLQEFLVNGIGNGYLPSTGSKAAKAAIAKHSCRDGFAEITEDDVIITSGCSGAVELSISVLLDEGDSVLIPRPGFPLYEVITRSIGAEVKYYNLRPHDNWNCDVNHLEQLITSNTKAILVNNPSNPCGSNFSRDNLLAIADVARRHSLPIIADEIYGGCVFNGEFLPMFTIAPDIPILSLGGLAKEFVVPGWRLGWIVIHDTTNRFQLIRNGLKSLSQIILGANSLVQMSLPRVLTPTPGSADARSLASFHDRYMSILRSNASLCAELGDECPELDVVVPAGAMYAMIGIKIDQLDSIVDDKTFTQMLLDEENLFLFPGSCFGLKNYIRIVICPPSEVIREAFERIKRFINNHRLVSFNNKKRPIDCVDDSFVT